MEDWEPVQHSCPAMEISGAQMDYKNKNWQSRSEKSKRKAPKMSRYAQTAEQPLQRYRV